MKSAPREDTQVSTDPAGTRAPLRFGLGLGAISLVLSWLPEVLAFRPGPWSVRGGPEPSEVEWLWPRLLGAAVVGVLAALLRIRAARAKKGKAS